MYKVKINQILDGIQVKDDLLYLRLRDLEHVIAEMFRRMGYGSIKLSKKIGEDGHGLILDNQYYVQISKTNYNGKINVELAAKLAKHMARDEIYRGTYITLGDFKTNTLTYCHKNVIQCINGDKLLEMCKRVQNDRQASKSAVPY